MNNKTKRVVTNDATGCRWCANAKKYIVEVEDINRCAGCSTAHKPYTGDLIDTIYDICIKSANKLIGALLWLLADDHKAGDFSNDEWTYNEINIIHKYIAYVMKCKGKGVIPMPLNKWLTKYGDKDTHAVPAELINKFKGIRETLIAQNELDAEYGDPAAAHKRRLKKMQETQNNTSSNKNESSSDNSPTCM